jgi:hypothetical protein
VAQQLAGTRPAVERAVVALEGRYGFDNSSFSKSLGLSPERANERAREIATTWAEQLDPAMMAWSGPGACAELSGILATNGLPLSTTPLPPTGTDDGALPAAAPTVQSLLDIAPVVAEHAKHCSTCGERLRLLTPVRVLVGQNPLEHVPPRVARAARTARRRLPVPLPPSIDPRRFTAAHARGMAIAGLVIACALIIGLGVVRVADRGGETQAQRVQRLVQQAPMSRLLATPSVMTPGSNTADLANNGNDVLLWHATSSVPWLTLSPSSGRLEPNQSISVEVHRNGSVATADAVITFEGSDGSTQVIRFQNR